MYKQNIFYYAGPGDRMAETRRRSKRHGDGFAGPWRSFCKSGGSELIFAGLMAPLHPLPYSEGQFAGFLNVLHPLPPLTNYLIYTILLNQGYITFHSIYIVLVIWQITELFIYLFCYLFIF